MKFGAHRQFLLRYAKDRTQRSEPLRESISRVSDFFSLLSHRQIDSSLDDFGSTDLK